MIDIKKLTQKDIGKWVVYHGCNRDEYGKIKSFSDKYVFVVYESPGKDMSRFQDYTGVATKPEDLDFK